MGLSFFWRRGSREESIVAKVDASLAFVADRYDFQGGGLPYTICDYLDTARVPDESHSLYGHKFELRVVVYRDGEWLRAFPSIAKVCCRRYDGGAVDRSMLINNVTASSTATRQAGREYVLPLANERTLSMLGIEEAVLMELCQYCVGYVSHVVDGVERPVDRIERLRRHAAEPLLRGPRSRVVVGRGAADREQALAAAVSRS